MFIFVKLFSVVVRGELLRVDTAVIGKLFRGPVVEEQLDAALVDAKNLLCSKPVVALLDVQELLFCCPRGDKDLKLLLKEQLGGGGLQELKLVF